jgi:hypothetical protein
MQPLIADDSNLSLAIGAAGSFAALLSVVIASAVQRDVVRQRRRQHLESAIQQALLVRWAAQNPAHFWGEPLENYKLAFQRLPRSRSGVISAKQLFEHPEPSKDRDRWDSEAAFVDELAGQTVQELRNELAKLP